MSLVGQIILQSLRAIGSVSNFFTVKEVTDALEGSGILGASRRILMPDGTPVPDETLVSYNKDGSMNLHSQDPRFDGKTLQTALAYDPESRYGDPYSQSLRGAQSGAIYGGPVTSADYEEYGQMAQRLAGPTSKQIFEDPRLLGGLGIAGIIGTTLGARELIKRRKATTKKAPVTRRKAPKKKTQARRKAPKKKTKSKRSPGGSHFALAGGARGSHRIKYTKTGQPYILEHSGKARFIKRSSAAQASRRTGGYG
jgi:hypothetical protein